MRKTEMSTQQLGERTLIVDTLRRSAWDAPSNENEMFDEGLWLQCEAVLEYRGPAATLSVFYRADQNAMYVVFEMLDERRFEIKLDVDNRLGEVLAVITSFQDTLTELNYRSCIRELMKICEPIYVSTDGDNFKRLTDLKNQTLNSEPSNFN